jgi:hypothetical protein
MELARGEQGSPPMLARMLGERHDREIEDPFMTPTTGRENYRGAAGAERAGIRGSYHEAMGAAAPGLLPSMPIPPHVGRDRPSHAHP